jgi:cbb3-type cytochrome oxidase subunit 3
MEWLKTFLPVIEAGLKMYISGQVIKKTSENAKSIALRSSIIAFGTIAFLIFFVAATVMTFIDLGHQLDAHDGVHFSGMMISSLLLISFGLLVFGICFAVIKFIETKEKNKKELEKDEVSPYAPLILFAEELLKNLINNLNQSTQKPDVTPDI